MCRESVWEYLSDWEALTERMAFWVSLEDAYVTMTNDYVQSLWWILKQLWDKGPPLRRLQSRPLLSPLRHAPQQP